MKERKGQDIAKERSDRQPAPFDQRPSNDPLVAKQGGKEPGKKKKSKWCCWGCLIFLLLAVLLPGYVAVASGMVRIPLLTPLIYGKGPEPKRIVEPAQTGIKAVAEKMAKAAKTGQNQVTLTEGELTALLREDNQQFRDANLTIDPDEIEVFGYLDQGGYQTGLTIGFVPRITGGKIDFRFKRVKLGKLPIPIWGINFISKKIIAGEQEAINERMADISKIELGSGELKIEGDIKKMMEEKKGSNPPSQNSI